MEWTGRPLLATRRDQEVFVGFSTELEAVRKAVGARLNVLLLGERGSGKSSMLHRLTVNAASDDGWTPVFVDGHTADSAADLLLLVRERAGGGRSPRTPGSFSIDTTDALDELGRTIDSRPAGVPRLVVLLDGVPTTATAHLLFGRLRDQLWQLNLTWVIAADRNERAEYLTPPADAFFEAIVEIAPLSDEEALQLLERRCAGADVPLEVLHSIVAAGAGVPRNLVRLAQEVFVSDKQLKDEKTNQEQLRRAIDELGRPAAMLAVELAQLGPVSASDQRLLTRTGWSRPRAVQVLRQLEEAGFVESGSTIQGGRRRKLYWLSRSAP